MNTSVIEVRAPRSTAEWTAYYALRWRILRAPWQQGGPERDATDDTSVHRLVCNAEGQVVAVGRLHRIEGTSTAQFRFMAVDDDQQRKGYGTLLLKTLEQAARELELDTVILQARENAVPFYRRHGYQVQKKTFLLFDEIQHYLMSKRLDG